MKKSPIELMSEEQKIVSIFMKIWFKFAVNVRKRGRCAFSWLSCFLKSRYCFQLLIVHKPAEDRRKFAGLSTFDLATGTCWKDFLKYMVCYRMIVIKCVCLWDSEKLSVLFCSVCQCIYSLCCCTSDVSIEC